MMKHVKVTIDTDRNNVVLNGVSDMIADKYGLVNVILDIDTNLTTNFGNVREVKDDVELTIVLYNEDSILYNITGKLDGQVEALFHYGKFSRHIKHTSQKELDSKTFLHNHISNVHPLYRTLEKRFIKDYKDLYPKTKGV